VSFAAFVLSSFAWSGLKKTHIAMATSAAKTTPMGRKVFRADGLDTALLQE
jgi:hypothetical protein